MPSSAFVSYPGPPAPHLHGELDELLTGLRQDVVWLDRCLAEQAGGSEDEVRTLRMQMRIRCDGMGDQLARVAGHLERIVAGLPPGGETAVGPSRP